jgi:hypothetical protein
VFPPGALSILRFCVDGGCAGGNVESIGTDGEQRLRSGGRVLLPRAGGLVLCMIGALIRASVAPTITALTSLPTVFHETRRSAITYLSMLFVNSTASPA